jgi:hypothetical protein
MKKKTGKQYTPAITTRFLLIMDETIRDGHTENRTTFAKSVGEHQQNLPAMENGTRSPTLEQIATACRMYGYSPTWLIFGTGDKKMKAKDEMSLDQRISELEAEVARIKRLVKK